MLHHAVLHPRYSVHGPDTRTYASWVCLLCDARCPVRPWAAALRSVDQHLTLTHRVSAPCLRIHDVATRLDDA